MKIKIRPCICTKESVSDNSIYYGMPQLKVTDCNESNDIQYYESFCPEWMGDKKWTCCVWNTFSRLKFRKARRRAYGVSFYI